MKSSKECTILSEDDLLKRLTEHKALSAAPRAELEWLVAHGTYCQFAPGEVIALKGGEIGGMQIIFTGRLALFLERGSGPVKLVEWGAGEITGALPYSRVIGTPGDAIAQEATEVFLVARECFQEMTRQCFSVTTMLVHAMLDRARTFTAGDLHDEKMISLGKLSAGLAHELNNPASAIERSASGLQESFEAFETAARSFASFGSSERQAEALAEVHALSRASEERSALDHMDREEAISDWLAAHGLDTADAAVLAETEVTISAMDRLASVLDGAALGDALRSAAGGHAIRTLANGIQDGARRISRLVSAIKGFTHMDQANILDAVDLGPALRDTVAVLCSKAQQRSAEVTLELEPDLPRVQGYAGELNQIWAILIDNALDAVAHGGRVKVLVGREGARVVVRVCDNGTGVPTEIRNKIFDPFFTTKQQGQGMGLGLDIARRLAQHSAGTIEFDSAPGATEFRVILPVAEG